MKDLGAGAERLREGRRHRRHHHELLDIDVAVGVRPAVQDVHHRHGQRRAVRTPIVGSGRRGRRRAVCLQTRRTREPSPSRRRGSRSRPVGSWSASRRERSSARRRRADPAPCRRALRPARRSRAPTAFLTPLPRYRALSPSRSSSASRSPVDAPDGTIARPVAPLRSATSTSTVGFPRESRISRPCTFAIVTDWPPQYLLGLRPSKGGAADCRWRRRIKPDEPDQPDDPDQPG